MTAKDGKIPLHEMRDFVNTAFNYGAGSESASYEIVDSKGKVLSGELKVMLPLPKDKIVVGKKTVTVKAKTKHAQQVDEQIAKHKEEKKEGNKEEGYVPPVGKKGPPKQQKIKCPRCGIRKPVQRVNKMRILKPHVSKGEPCPGGGVQV